MVRRPPNATSAPIPTSICQRVSLPPACSSTSLSSSRSSSSACRPPERPQVDRIPRTRPKAGGAAHHGPPSGETVAAHDEAAERDRRRTLPAAGPGPRQEPADRGHAGTGLPNCSDDPIIEPDDHRHRQALARGPAPPPRAGGACDPPTRPGRRHDQWEPRTTGREHIGARDPYPTGNRRPRRSGPGARQRPSAATRCRHAAHPRPDRRLPRRVRDGRLPRCRWSRADPDATGPHSRPSGDCSLARAPAGASARPASSSTPSRRQPHPTPTVHGHRAHQRGLRGDRQRPHGGAFAWRQLAQAGRRQGAVPSLRIRQSNAFATPPPRPDTPWRP